MASNVVQESLHKMSFLEHINLMMVQRWLGPNTPVHCVPCNGNGKDADGKTCSVCLGNRSIPYSDYMVPRPDFAPKEINGKK